MEKKKVSELGIDELYEHFKKGVIEVVKRHFNGPKGQLLEPAVFLGVKSDTINRMSKKHEEIKEQLDMHNAIKPDGYQDYSISTPLIPLGPFFDDHGSETLNKLSKAAAMALIQTAIREMKENDMNGVMFSCFVSECFMAKVDAKTNNDNVKLHLGDTEVIDGAMKGYDRVRDMPEAEEKVVLIFETSQYTEMIQFDIMESDEDKMMVKQKSLGKTNLPGQGLMSGILHRPETAFTAN